MFIQRSTIFLALATAVAAVDKTVDSNLDISLKQAPTQLDRSALLADDSQWLFDFRAQAGYTYSPGSVVNGNAATFPAATGFGMTVAMLNLGPCAMLPPHIHPRATNFVVAVEGTTDTFMITENGARVVRETLTPGKMTIFPTASLHTMQNTGCGNATLVSALNSDDTGTHNWVNGLSQLPAYILNAAFGQFMKNASEEAFGKVPPVGTGSILGDAACIARCAGNAGANPSG